MSSRVGTLVDVVSQNLLGLDDFNMVDVGVVLVEDLYLVGIDELAITAYMGIRVLVRNDILRRTLQELFEYHCRRLIFTELFYYTL